MDENENKSNKSLFLYTALIFLVALAIIIISFFGQNHLQEAEEIKQNSKSLTEKASVISEENLHLTSKISDLEETLEKKDEEIASLNEQIIQKQNNADQLNALISANENCNIKAYDFAYQLISTVDKSKLVGDSLILYNSVVQKIEKGKEEK